MRLSVATLREFKFNKKYLFGLLFQQNYNTD